MLTYSELGVLELTAASVIKEELIDVNSEEYRTSLSLIYGKPGVPENEVQKLMSNVTPTNGQHGVQVLRDHVLEYPSLFLGVFIAGDRYEEAAFAPMFARAHCQRAKSVLEADLVVFTGGADVDPQLYGETAHPKSYFDTKRDSDDMALYMMCLEEGIPMLGICRGAQFLSVMNGGKLYQDVNNHYGDHSIYDFDSRRMIQTVSSVHHQMVFPNPEGGMHIIAAAAGKSTKRVGPGPMAISEDKTTDIEAFFYRDTCCLGIQGHPEYSGYTQFTKWSLEKIEAYVCNSTDVILEKSTGPARRRLSPDILAQRNHTLGIKTAKGAA